MPKGGDTGLLKIRAEVRYARVGSFIDGSATELSVEVWSSVPFGNERCHHNVATIKNPVTDARYEQAYRLLLCDYEDHWKLHGAIPPPDWKEQFARACGTAMGKWMDQAAFRAAI